jgi:hypothetical protein
MESDINLTDGFAGAKLNLVNPETGEGVVVNVSPSVMSQIEDVFGEDVYDSIGDKI